MNVIQHFEGKYRLLQDESDYEMSDDESGSDELSDSEKFEGLGALGLI